MKIYRDKKTVPSLFPTIQGMGGLRWFKVASLVVPDISEGDVLEVKGFYTIENNQSFGIEHVTLLAVSEQELEDDYIISPFTGYDNDEPTKYGLGLVQDWNKIPYNGQNITPNPGQHYDSPFVLQDYVADNDYGNLYFSMWVKLTSSAANGSQVAKMHPEQTFFQVKHTPNTNAEIIYQTDSEPAPDPEITWSNSYQVNNTLDAGNLINMGLRVVIPSSKLSTSGDKVRLTLQAPTVSGNTTHVVSCYIAEKTGAYGPAGTPQQVKFGGNAGFSLTYGSPDLVSDIVDFAIDETKNYVLFFGCASANGYCARTEAPYTNAYWKSNASGDGLNMSPSGYTHDGACGEYIIKKIEVSI